MAEHMMIVFATLIHRRSAVLGLLIWSRHRWGPRRNVEPTRDPPLATARGVAMPSVDFVKWR
ncbi:MAG: hypothetical protein D6723_13755 [Acidobacteria bacterium]|nr:MAG: hypothetical protein D6723_13755 [Acidobacteriota bacterium]